MPTCVRSYSKINLGLAIGALRADGFHDLTTLYQTLAAHDLVTVAVQPQLSGMPSHIAITSNDARVPLDERNTVWRILDRAIRAWQARRPEGAVSAPSPAGQSRELAVSAHIEKRLPMQGGLGAGSANAAAALLAFEQELGFELGEQGLRLAAEVGSDIPLFLLGGAVLGTGRGEQVAPLPDLVPSDSSCQVVLALPKMGVSTPQAFRDWDAHQAISVESQPEDRLTPVGASDRLEGLSRALALAFREPHPSSGVFPLQTGEDLARHPLAALVRTGIRNDFEQVVFRQHPFLGTIKRALEATAEPGDVSSPACAPLYAALSGSGSALFGLYPDEESAAAAESRVESLNVRTLRTRLMGRAAYWNEMFMPPATNY